MHRALSATGLLAMMVSTAASAAPPGMCRVIRIAPDGTRTESLQRQDRVAEAKGMSGHATASAHGGRSVSSSSVTSSGSVSSQSSVSSSSSSSSGSNGSGGTARATSSHTDDQGRTITIARDQRGCTITIDARADDRTESGE